MSAVESTIRGKPRSIRFLDPWQDEPAAQFGPRKLKAARQTARHGKQRVIFLGPQAQLVLRPYLADRGDEFRPRPMLNRPYTIHGLQASIVRACTKAEVKRWGAGRLRHNFATNVRAAYDIDAARVVLGHSEATTTEIYAERDWSRAAEIAATVGWFARSWVYVPGRNKTIFALFVRLPFMTADHADGRGSSRGSGFTGLGDPWFKKDAQPSRQIGGCARRCLAANGGSENMRNIHYWVESACYSTIRFPLVAGCPQTDVWGSPIPGVRQ